MQDNIPDALIAAFERHYSLDWNDPAMRNERLAWRAAWAEAKKPCLHQIQEPEADIWPCVNIDVDENGKITNAKLYSPGLPAGNHDVYPVRVPYMDEHTEAWRACVDELEKAVPGFMSLGNMNGIECAVAAIRGLSERAKHQEPAAAEQAAWHAGLDEGRAQAEQPEDARELVTLALGLSLPPKGGPSFAWSYLLSSIRELVKCEEELTLLKAGMDMSKAAPAAVAAPDLQDMLRELRVQIHKITVQLAPTSDCSGVWMAHDKMSTALAATPAAAPGKLGDDMQIRCRKCGEQATVEFNSARIVTHNPHTGKPRDARDMASDPAGKLIVAPGPLFAAAAPVVLPEPAIPASQGVCCGNFTAGAQYMGQTESLCCGNPDEAHPAYYTEQQVRALLATATGLPAQAVEMPDFDLRTSKGGRGFVAWYFANVLQRYDYENYITNKLAADFACDLAKALSSTLAAPQAQADARDAEQPRLTVRLISFPESNGKRNWTAMFMRSEKFDGLIGNAGGITIARGECWNRVAYHAEEARFLLGERGTEPDIMAYGDDVHTPHEWSGEDADGVFAAIAAAKGESQ